jgi:hypothetical protein
MCGWSNLFFKQINSYNIFYILVIDTVKNINLVLFYKLISDYIINI